MSDKIKNYIIIGLGLTLVIIWLLRSCESKPIQVNTPRQDSFRTVIKYHDSTRLHHINKWRTITRIVDSVKCYEEIKYLIAECDTIIKIDSVQIASLKGLVRLDSNIQVILFKRIRSDSTLIVKLNKKVKRNKVLAKLAFVTGLFGGGYLGVKVAR